MDFAVNVESKFSINLLRRFNVWYSVRDGNWSDPNTWMSNALDKKNYTSPMPGDDVYINHTITHDLASSANITINNLFISGKLTAANNSQTLTVGGNLQAIGVIDFTGSNITLGLNGVFNSIISANFIAGNSTVNFGAPYNDQIILDLSYNNLSTSGAKKYAINNLSIPGTFSIMSNIVELSTYNLTVTGQTTVGNIINSLTPTSQLSKNGAGSILFIGNVNLPGGSGSAINLNFTGNPSVEFRGGISRGTQNTTPNFGTGAISFTTNNQTISGSSATYAFTSNVTISGAITLTLGGSCTMKLTGATINGNNALSTLSIFGSLTFDGNASASGFMSTGVLTQNAGSTVTYTNFTGSSFNLPYTSYQTLSINSSSGVTFNLTGNTVINGNFNCFNGFDNGTYTLTVNGSTGWGTSGGNIKNTGGGAILLIGQLTLGTNGALDFSTGNPTVELRGGFQVSSGFDSFNGGSSNWTFTTNNQNFNTAGTITLNANFVIAAGIKLTVPASTIAIVSGTITGASSTSILDNRGTLTYKNATAPMATGKLYCNQAANTFIYGGANNQDIQVLSDPTNPGYYNLTLNGGAFAKKLLGNVSVKQVYTLTSPTTLDSNGFSLTNP